MLSHVSNGSLPLDPQISVFYPKQEPCVFITDGVNLVVMQNYLFQWNFLLIILNVQICEMHIKAAILKDHLQLVALSTLYCAVITTSHLQKSFRLAELKLPIELCLPIPLPQFWWPPFHFVSDFHYSRYKVNHTLFNLFLLVCLLAECPWVSSMLQHTNFLPF